MVITCKLGALSGRRRLFDASGGTAADQGAFLVDGRIEGESLSTVPLTANTYFQLVLVRGGGFLKGYRDGFLVVTDTDDGSPLSNGLRFFQDYVNNPVQASGGSIARPRFYEGMMTEDQIAALDRVPETSHGRNMPLLTVSNRFGRPNRFRMNIYGTTQHNASVSSIDTTVTLQNDGFSLNAFKRRETSTTVEMCDGESFAIAGLLQDDFRDLNGQVPWLGDIPVLGALFRSAEYERAQSELVIIVTPHLVTPTRGEALALPTDRIKLPTEKDLFLFGNVAGGPKGAAGEVARQDFTGSSGYVME